VSPGFAGSADFVAQLVVDAARAWLTVQPIDRPPGVTVPASAAAALLPAAPIVVSWRTPPAAEILRVGGPDRSSQRLAFSLNHSSWLNLVFCALAAYFVLLNRKSPMDRWITRVTKSARSP